MNQEALTALQSAIDNLHEMQQMVGENEHGPDSPKAFLEAAADTRYYLDQAVQAGLAPVLG